jgi:DNA-binding response OmpR family regulator
MKKILLIEDNAEFSDNVMEILEMAGYKVVIAADGKEGIKMTRKEIPDLIICDIMMPDLDGFGVLHVIHKDPELTGIPFIFLSAKNEDVDIRKGMNLGADDFLRKPVQGEELLKAVETRLAKVESMNAKFAALKGAAKASDHAPKADITLEKFISADRESRRYPKKQIVYKEGNRLGPLFYIVSGKVKIFKTSELGDEYIIDILKEGDFFGYNAILEGTMYTDNAEALEDVELKLIPKEDFLALIYDGNNITKQFIQRLTKDVIGKEDQLIKLAYNSLRKRVADGVIFLHDKFKNGEKNNPDFKISRQNLANVTGARKESVIRMLSDFKDEKLIDIKDGNIVLLKEDKLRTLCN